MRTGVLALVLIGCGSVDKLPPDAPPLDAYQPDSLVCETGKMACNGTCEDVMTDPAHCGSCSNTCDPSQLCSSGTCIAQYCARVKEMNPAATDGIYPNPNPGATGDLYCDFTNGQTYYDLLVSAWTVVPPEHNIVTPTDFMNASFQKAFIALYNQNQGARVYAQFSSNNCCMAYTSGTNFYAFNALPLFVGKAAATACGQTYATTDILTFCPNGSNCQTTMPDNFFSSNTPGTYTGCSNSNTNGAWFIIHRPSLN